MYAVKNILLWAFLLLMGGRGKGQPLRFESFTTENGLSQNSGYDVAQTPEGFMWFGTQNGLDRYDGYEMKHYRKDSTQNSLPDNHIYALLADDAGNLWVGTRNGGIVIYVPSADKFYQPLNFYKITKNIGALFAKRLLKDKKGNIWIMSPGKGLFSFNIHTKAFHHYFKDADDDLNLYSISINEKDDICVSVGYDILVLKEGTFVPLGLPLAVKKETDELNIREFEFTHGELWAGSENQGLFRFDLTGGPRLMEHITTQTAGWHLMQNEFECLAKNNDGNIWIGTTNDGIYLYDYATNTVRNGRHNPTDFFSLKSNFVVAIFEDAQHIAWLGLNGGGVAKYDATKSFFNHLTFNEPAFVEKGITDNKVCALLNENNKTVLMGTWAGGMINTAIDFTNPMVYKCEPGNKTTLPGNGVRGFAKDTNNNLWIATDAGLCQAYAQPNQSKKFITYDDTTPHKYLYSLIKLKHQNALLVSGTTGLFLFDLGTKKWVPLNDPQQYTQHRTLTANSMVEYESNQTLPYMPAGTVWLCTGQYGLIAYNYLNGSFKEYNAVKNISKTVRQLLLIGTTMWVATDNGLLQTNLADTAIVTRYISNEGLPGNVAYALINDDSGGIWISTNSGISRFDTLKKIFINYAAGGGIKGMEFNTAVCFKASNGSLYFGGTEGVVSFLPNNAPRNTAAPNTVITGVDVLNTPYATDSNIAYTSQLVFNAHQNFISFHFSAPNYYQTINTQYSCMLRGIDENWVNIGSRNYATYTNLPPGNYTFKVKAANSNGQWCDKITSLRIVILPPWYKTWWFKTLLALLFAGGCYIFYKSRINAVRTKAAMDGKMAEYELKALHAQMNPHFIFNCLASIKQMMMADEKETASKYLGKFSKLIRQTLEHSRQSLISVRLNNEYIATYIEMEQLRFGKSFGYTIEVADGLDTDEWKIPPLIIQPLVENAIWHGLMQQPQDARLIIRIFTKNNQLYCEVDDNGPGYYPQNKPAGQHKSYGLQNIEDRLDLLNSKYGQQCSLKIINKATLGTQQHGTLATIIFTSAQIL